MRPLTAAAMLTALAAMAMPVQGQTLAGALGAVGVASSLQGIGSNAAAIGLGAANNAVNNLGGRRPAPAVPTVASGTASTRPATTGGTATTATTARPAPATNNRPAPATTPARPAPQPATPARPATTPARPAPTPATPRPTGGTANTGTNNNATNTGGTNNGTNGNATTGTGGTNGTGTQTGGSTPGRGAGYTANLANNGYGRGVRGGTATASLGGRTLTPLRPVFNTTALGQTLRDARINIRMGFSNISSTAGTGGNATARP